MTGLHIPSEYVKPFEHRALFSPAPGQTALPADMRRELEMLYRLGSHSQSLKPLLAIVETMIGGTESRALHYMALLAGHLTTLHVGHMEDRMRKVAIIFEALAEMDNALFRASAILQEGSDFMGGLYKGKGEKIRKMALAVSEEHDMEAMDAVLLDFYITYVSPHGVIQKVLTRDR